MQWGVRKTPPFLFADLEADEAGVAGEGIAQSFLEVLR